MQYSCKSKISTYAPEVIMQGALEALQSAILLLPVRQLNEPLSSDIASEPNAFKTIGMLTKGPS